MREDTIILRRSELKAMIKVWKSGIWRGVTPRSGDCAAQLKDVIDRADRKKPIGSRPLYLDSIGEN